MNVLEICDDYPPFATGGIGTSVLALAQEWRRIGVKVHVLCLGSGRGISTESEGGLKVTRLPNPNFPPRTLWFQIKALRLLQRYVPDADIVHAHGTSCAVLAMTNRKPRRPWVVTVHGLSRRAFPLYFARPIRGRTFRDELVYIYAFPYAEALFRAEQCLADHLVFVSRQVLRDARQLYGAHLVDKSSSIWMPVSETAFIQGTRLREKRFTYAFVGRLYWSKGATFLLNAFSRLAKVRQDVVLRLYGSGPMEGAIRRRVRELGLRSSVEFRGWMEHKAMLSELSSDVDVVVHPSLYEACPITVLEAMSLGKPIIVSDLPWSREFVKDGVTGLRSRLDELSLSSQMEKLREDKELRSRLGMNARLFAWSNFRPEVIARAYLDLFDKLSGH